MAIGALLGGAFGGGWQQNKTNHPEMDVVSIGFILG